MSRANRTLSELSLTVLVDNEAGDFGLAGEHGFACLVTTPNAVLLFDTGQGATLLDNARRLSVELRHLDAVIWSHGHYDHTGGTAELLRIHKKRLRIVAHPAALGPHFSRSTGTARDIGLPMSVRSHLAEVDLELSAEPKEVVPGVWTTGAIPRLSDEDVGGPLFADQECQVADPLLDDQALILRHHCGLVVVFGCAHSGVLNTLYRVAALFPGERVLALLGGMHLMTADRSRIDRSLDALESSGALWIGPCHCTGAPRTELAQALGTRYGNVAAGTHLTVDATGEVTARMLRPKIDEVSL